MHFPTTPGRIVRAATSLIVFAALVAVPLSGVHNVVATPTEQTLRVTVSKGDVSVVSTDDFSVSVSTQVNEPTPYLEIRFQLRAPAGRLLFQRTEVRNQVETSTVGVTFERELGDLSLEPGVYPYEVRVRTEVGEPREQILEGTLLVHAPSPPSTPVALAVRVGGVPGFDPQGLSVVDPDTIDGPRDAVDTLAAAVIAEPELRLSLIIPPVMLDEWSRIAGGYQFAGPTGVVDVPADDETPLKYRATLDVLKAALETGRLELLDIPYADPDISGLLATRSLQDLGIHYARSMSTYLSTLETSPSVGTAIASDSVNDTVLEVIAERDVEYVVSPYGSMRTGEETAAPGPWSVTGTPLTALVSDPEIGALLASADTSATLDHVFARAISTDATVPLPAVCDTVRDGARAVAAVLGTARVLVDVPWAHLALMDEAAAAPSRGQARAADYAWTIDAPSGYWEEVAAARRYAHAFETAVGVNDPDAQAVTNASLLAQSRSWAGPDGRWSLADRGRAYSSAATRGARSFLDLVVLTAKDVTLAGPKGDVPLNITNNSTKTLTVTLKMEGDGTYIAGGPSQRITLRPQENFHTVAVDLQSSLSSDLAVEVWASEVMLTSGVATIRASYLDRLAVIGAVATVLLGLLYYIRRRVRAADAGKIPS